MKRYSVGSPDSSINIAKKAKEFLSKKETSDNINEVSNVESGLKNPCVFGKHNPDFDKQIDF